MSQTDYYCNQKFWWLSIDMQRQQQASCCAAASSDIDFAWLSNNPGSLFNTPLLLQERQQMLNNECVDSCKSNCFVPEQQGLVSRRITDQGYLRSHSSLTASPRTVNIVLGTTCNLTCVYCCKQYSSSWQKDIVEHGPYLDSDRFRIWPNDQLLKHNDLVADVKYQTLMHELSCMNPEVVHISGGEPFLYNNLVDMVNNLQAKTVRIHTGLGVDTARFGHLIDKFGGKTNLEILISAETQGPLYELVRSGNSYQRFLDNCKILQQSGLITRFMSVISNLTVLGLLDFYQSYSTSYIHWIMCNEPDFLSVHVLDPETKNKLRSDLSMSGLPARHMILQNLESEPSALQHSQFAVYVKEFARRRQLDLSILPQSLLTWIHHGSSN